MWRLIYSPIAWALYIAVEILFIALGWILIPIAAACRAYEVDPRTQHQVFPVYHWRSRFMFVWDNEDDGIVDPGYSNFKSMFMRIVYWSANRNPCDNLKYIPLLCVQIFPQDVRFVGSFGSRTGPFVTGREVDIFNYDTKVTQWWFAWQGFYTGFYWVFIMPFTIKIPFTKLGYFKGDMRLFWIGWKIKPGDMFHVEKYRTPRAPGGIQFDLVKSRST